jgi:hypothetical protein
MQGQALWLVVTVTVTMVVVTATVTMLVVTAAVTDAGLKVEISNRARRPVTHLCERRTAEKIPRKCNRFTPE